MKQKVLIELLALLVIGGPAVAVASSRVLMPADGGMPQLAAASDDGGKSTPKNGGIGGALAKAGADGGY